MIRQTIAEAVAVFPALQPQVHWWPFERYWWPDKQSGRCWRGHRSAAKITWSWASIGKVGTQDKPMSPAW